MGQITLTAQLIAAPATSNDQNFPSGTTTIPFATTPNPKPYLDDSGRNNNTVNSANAYIPLAGLGDDTSARVTQAHTLYVRTSSPMLLRLTFGLTILADVPIQGTFLMEFPPGTPLTLVEIKGSGAVEWYIAGNT